MNLNIAFANLIKKYKEQILYLIFGGLTTLINYASYFVFSRVFGLSVVISTILAWIMAVIFAYITNKIWVFKSVGNGIKKLFREAVSFLGARVFSGILDVSIMAIFVDGLQYNDIVIKILSNIIVVIVNYVLSKFWIFKKD